MVHILQKLDPNNEVWREVQLEKAIKESKEAFEIEDKKLREQRLLEVNNAFDQNINDPDYARKLFLIENCIYGVDIQPIATQISKLRFFISLVTDQKVNPEQENFGIRPLPNLETKFVAANTLIGIEKPSNQYNLFETDEIKTLEKQLKSVRSKLFSARTKDTKIKYREKDFELRTAIAEKLKEQNFPIESAEMLASWDPYDQNASSPFFDMEWMFDVREGFDVVIGNPPYGSTIPREHFNIYKQQFRSTNTTQNVRGSMDTFSIFTEKGFSILQQNGILTYIVPVSFTCNESMGALHEIILGNSSIIKISNYAKRPQQIFSSACTANSIIMATKSTSGLQSILTTKLNRLSNNTTISEMLIDLSFINSIDNYKNGRIPKIGKAIENQILSKMFNLKNQIGTLRKEYGKPIYYRKAGGRYYNVVTNYSSTQSSSEGTLYFDKEIADSIGLILSSSLFWWFQQVYTDCFNLKLSDLDFFPLPSTNLLVDKENSHIYNNYLEEIERTKTNQYNIRLAKEHLLKIDKKVAFLYGLTEIEANFILNYEYEFRE